MARKPMKSYGPKQRIGKIRGKKLTTRRRNNLGRTIDLGFEMLEPKWVLASPGSLDPTFDLDGLVVGEFGSANVKLTSMAVQNDGKVVVAGTITTAGDPTEDIVVARFNVNGSLDTTFGDNDSIGGYTTFTFNGGQSFAWDVALDSSGNVIVAGQGRNVAATALGFGVARLGSDGELDGTFGTGGMTVTILASVNSEARGVAIQSDGKIVLAGTEFKSNATPTRNDFAVARYNTNGTLDSTFGVGGAGTVVTDFNGRGDAAFDVVIQKVGLIEKILVGGEADRSGSAINDFAMARYNPDGSLDTTGDSFDAVEFGVGGKVTTIAGTGALAQQTAQITGIALDSLGRIVVGGTVGDINASQNMAVGRYSADGLLDTATFNSSPAGVSVAGVQHIDFSTIDFGNSLLIQPDGQIVIGGYSRSTTTTTTSTYRWGLARLNATNGSLDSSFGTGGLVQVPAFLDAGGPDPPFEPAEPDDVSLAKIALTPDGKIVGAGYQDLETTDADYLLARYETGLVVSSISGPATVAEAATYTLTTTSGDPTTTSWTISWGDTTQIVAGNPSSVTHVYADGPNNYTISATVTTSTGTFAVGNTVAVAVTNLAPTLAISGSSGVNEGSTYTLNLSSSDPGPDTITSWTISWGDSTQVVAGNPLSVTHVYADGPNNYTISATATDEDGTYSAGNTVAVAVSNVAPTLAISGAASVNEGALYTLSLSSSDVGTDTITSWTINWGDAIEVVSGNPGSVSHTYADGANSYTISATATDEDGTFAAGNTVAVSVLDVAPVLAISGASDMNEGSSYLLGLSASDVGADTVTQWTIDWGDGIEIVSGNPSSVAHAYVDGDASYTISATATNEDGTFAVGNTVAVAVHNVAPTLAINGASDVNEGSSYTLNLTSSDPGTDTITSWTINWGDAIEVVSGNPASVAHTYADGNASYTISATATDEDGTFAAGNTVAVTVHDVAPTLAISGAADVNEGSSYTLSLSAADAGTDTIASWTINWGESVQVVSGNPASVSHTYADGNAGYTISATATNEDGTFAAGNTVGVAVHNVAPTLTIGGAAIVSEGSLYTLNLSSSDPGADAITSWTINWGDSLQVVSGNPASVTHTYADGTAGYTISATATDEDGTYAANTVAVTVNNVAPTLAISGAASVNEGSTYTLNLSSSDPGADTITSWTINWGDGTQIVSGNPSSVTHVYADGTINRTISASATDEDGTFAAGNTVVVTVNNVAPALAISGAASVNEGSTYTLNLSSSDPGADTITSWTINWGDGIQVVAGHPSSVTHVYADGNGSSNYTITATATDEDGTYAAGNTVAVTVANVAPTANTGGPYQTFEDTPVVLSGSGTDPAGAADPLTFKWDLDGDGIFGESGAGATRGNEVGANVTYNPTGLGNTTQTVKLQVNDGDGGVTVATTTVQIQGQGTLLVGGVLYIVGSNSSDIVAITKVGSCIVVLATFNSNNPMTFNESAVTDIQVRMRGGNDIVVTTPNVTKTMTIDGGDGKDLLTGGGGRNLILGGSGNDVLYGDGGDDVLLGGTGNDDLFGGSGNDVLVGGDGNDVLRGGTGRDVLIGSQDDDCLDGGADEDVLIGGVTIHDNNVAALDAVMSIWGSSSSFSSRVATLTGSGGLLQAGVAVFDDDDNDWLNGGAGRDLYFGDNNPWDGAVDSISLQALQDQLIAVT